jgi:sulfonate dioxygenase
MLIAD